MLVERLRSATRNVASVFDLRDGHRHRSTGVARGFGGKLR